MASKPTSLVTNSISSCLPIPNRTHKTQRQHQHISYASSPSSNFALRFNISSLSCPQQSQCTHFGFRSLLHSERYSNLVCVHAQKKRGKGSTAVVEMNDFDEDEFDDLDKFDDLDDANKNYDVDDGGGDGDGDGDDDDEGMFLPSGEMKKWFENKPRGFGEGKVYDTSIEDKLLEEMEQSRLAQAGNINNLKNTPVKPTPKKENQNKKVLDVVPNGICVRVVNLPKKKNIDRDLKSAFKGVPGIIDIIPAVSGNKKTKDPICKGLAFVYFKSEADAARFLQLFSRQTVVFGKIQKQIKCEITNSNISKSFYDESAGNFSSNQLLMVSDLEGNLNTDFKMDDSSFEVSASDISDGPDNELADATLENETEIMEYFSVLELHSIDSTELRVGPATSPFSPKTRDKKVKIQPSKKKIIVKGGQPKVPKLDIPGSAKRLKIKEKAVLTDVFTKYGVQVALASAEES